MSDQAQTINQNPDPLLSSMFSASSLDFTSKLPASLVDTFAEIQTLEHLVRAIQDIEARQADRKSLRYLSKIKPCLNALNEYSRTIEVFVNAKPGIMAFVWGPIKACLLIASKYDKAFDSLLSAYVKIKDALPHFSAVEQIFNTNPTVRKVLGIVYKDILSFHLRALTFFTRKGWSIALRMTCRTLEDMFDDIFSNLEHSKELLYSSASIAHYQAAHEARQKTENMFRIQQETIRIQKKALVHAWLNPTEHHVWHERICDIRDRYPQTAKWVFNEPCWKSWLNIEEKNGRMFWMSGIPGAGKTVLFSGMVEELVSRSIGNKLSAIGYLYCKYNDRQRNNFTELTRSLIYQLISNNDICYDYLYDFAANSAEFTASKKQDLMAIMQNVLQCYDEVFIGIDGLDECEQGERGMMIKLFKELLKLPGSAVNLHIFVTSQAVLDIERFMASTPGHVKIEPEHVSDDIQCYVHERSAELARFDLTNYEMSDLNEKVSERSAGMFLLARLIFDLFERCTTRSDFDEEYAEKGLPLGIEEAYGRILSHIKKRDTESGRARAKLLLEILSSAKRKLYVHELQGMLSMDTINHRIDFTKRRYTQHFKEICGPLVELNPDGTVDLVHQTVKGYLDQYHSQYFSLAAAAFTSAKICTSYLALDCFHPILDDRKMAEAVMNGDFAFHKYALLQWLPHIYSLQDTQTPEAQIVAELGEDVQAICKNLDSFSRLAMDCGSEILPTERKTFEIMVERLKGLYDIIKQHDDETFSVLEQISRIQKFIEDGFSSEKGREKESFLKEAYGSRPYQCPNFSCLRFHYGFLTSQERDNHLEGHQRQFKCPFEVCEFSSIGLPTKKSLDVHIDMFHASTLLPQFSDLKPCSIWTLLLNSIETDDEALVENLCVEAAKSPRKPTGLVVRAISGGHIISARILLRHFCDLEDLHDAKNPSYKILLILAETGDVRLLQEILKLCPSLPWYAWTFNSALLKASTTGQIDMCMFLLEQMRLRDFKITGSSSAKLVVSVTQISDSNKSSMMLDAICKVAKGKDLAVCCIDLAGNGHKSALEQVLQRYFEAFADHAFKNKRFQKLKDLSIDDAARRLIYDTMDRSKARGSNYKSAFQYAALRGDIDELSRMLKIGIDINSVSGQYGTALQAASKKGHAHVVQWLLERGAQVETVGGEYGNAMAAAAAMGHVEVLKIMLTAGQSASPEARANKKKGYRNTTLSLPSRPDMAAPLHFAAAELREEAVCVLLEAGADVTAIDSNGNTALHMSILGPNIVYSPYSTRFSWNIKSVTTRIRQSSYVICRMLLEHGASVTAQNSGDNSPLQLLFIKDRVQNERESWCVRDDGHPCAMQLTKMLLEAGANFDTRNKKNFSSRDAVVAIGGQLLEDLKREVPAVWEDLQTSAGSRATNVPASSIGPPNNVTVDSMVGSCLDQDLNLSQEDESGKSKTGQILASIWNTDNMSDEMEVSYSSADAVHWSAINSNETAAYSHDVTNAEHQLADGMYEASNEIYQDGSGWNQLSNDFYQPSLDFLRNPWATDQDAETDQQMGNIGD